MKKSFSKALTLKKETVIIMDMKAYEHIQRFSIKYCDVDFKDELKVSAALSYLEEVACCSADELGFGYAYVKPRGYAFFLTNICCEFLTPIPLGAAVLVKTWPTPPSHVVFGREYQITDERGVPYMNATSRWCLVDFHSGKLLPAKAIDNQDYSTYNTAKTMGAVKWKQPAFKREEGECRFTLTIANSEYDHNMHVNNTRYADYCFNCFSIAELEERSLKKFTIAYVRQCREGETLSFYRKLHEDGSYLIQGFNEKGEIVTQAQIELV